MLFVTFCYHLLYIHVCILCITDVYTSLFKIRNFFSLWKIASVVSLNSKNWIKIPGFGYKDTWIITYNMNTCINKINFLFVVITLTYCIMTFTGNIHANWNLPSLNFPHKQDKSKHSAKENEKKFLSVCNLSQFTIVFKS
jgi:hypothetical protein